MYPNPYRACALPSSAAFLNSDIAVSLHGLTPTPFACMCPKCAVASASPAAAACAKYRNAALWSRVMPFAPWCSNRPTAAAAFAFPKAALY